jgi:hypothetical protein
MEQAPSSLHIKAVHTAKLGYIDNRRTRGKRAEIGQPTAALKFVVHSKPKAETRVAQIVEKMRCLSEWNSNTLPELQVRLVTYCVLCLVAEVVVAIDVCKMLLRVKTVHN